MATGDFLFDLNIYFNFFSFGTLLAVVFTGFLSVFLLTLPNKSKGTMHLGLAFFFFALFSLGYFLAAMYYAPEAAWHRYFTLGWVGPAFIHLAQWVRKFPRDHHPKASRILGIVQWAGWIGLMTYFIYVTQQADYKYHFTGHYWDFDAEFASKIGSYFIILYLLIFVGISIGRIIRVQGTQTKLAITAILFAVLAGAIPPSSLNTLSRDGSVDRGIFLISLVFCTVIAFFLIVVIYTNTTKDRTTFMAKIVGITLVTFLLVLQGLSYFFVEDKENQYNELRLEYAKRALEGGAINESIQYIARIPMHRQTQEQAEANPNGKLDLYYTSDEYFNTPPEKRIDFELAKSDFLNTALYQEIKSMPDTGFEASLEEELSLMPSTFDGYKKSIRTYLQNYNGTAPEKKQALLDHINELNQLAFVNSNRISYIHRDNFRENLENYLPKTKEAFAPFSEEIKDYLNKNPALDGDELKEKVLVFLSPFKAEETRHYRKSRDGQKHFVSYIIYNEKEHVAYETGYSYTAYRIFMHPSSYKQSLILFGLLIIVLGLFPLFFRGSLVSPLNNLLDGVRKVNSGDLEVKVPIHVQDEIGFLADSFNNMVSSIREARDKLQDYANNLEDKVKERTAELNQTLEEVQKLKSQQDGDYFLTSLLAKPLNFNANKSDSVQTDFLLEQKKKFEFRNKSADLGGDICVTGNLRFGNEEQFRRYVVAVNGDAMGKSMQGAGGAIVMGVVVNSIMARSARHDRILDYTPEQWLTEFYEELQGVFLAFNGSMAISAVVSVIDEDTGEMWYFNAEHPYTILYRNGKASFIEEELLLRKIGLESDIPFEVQRFQLEPGDVIIMGSDGRDDIDLSPGSEIRDINEDEYLILRTVESADADLARIQAETEKNGELTDDLSLLRLGFRESSVSRSSASLLEDPERQIIEIDAYDTELAESEFEELFHKGRSLAREGSSEEALKLLKQAYDLKKNEPALNKILAVLTFKGKEYQTAVDVLEKYLEHDPNIEDFWLYLSIAHKRTGNYDKALEAADKVFELNPQRVPNLIQLSDLHAKLGNAGRARIFAEKALDLEPDNRQAQQMMESLSART